MPAPTASNADDSHRLETVAFDPWRNVSRYNRWSVARELQVTRTGLPARAPHICGQGVIRQVDSEQTDFCIARLMPSPCARGRLLVNRVAVKTVSTSEVRDAWRQWESPLTPA